MTQSAVAPAVAPAFIAEARRYRELGGERSLLVDYLVRCGVDELSADQLADRFDVELCLAGAPRPADISAHAANYLDARASPAVSPVPPVPVPEPPARAETAAPSVGTALTALELARGMQAGTAPAQAEEAGHPAQRLSAADATPVTPTSPIAGRTSRPALQPMPAGAAGATQTIGGPAAVDEVVGFTTMAPEREAPPSMPAPSTPVPAGATTLAEAQAEHDGARRPAPQPATPPEKTSASTETTQWDETTEFGYRIAQSWDDADPNEAINEAASLARAGKSQEEIIDFLRSCNVSQGEAEYVAAMSGARRATPKAAPGAAKVSTRSRGRQRALAVAMIVAGLVVAYVGYDGWSSPGEGVATARSPLSVAAVGAALALNGIRTLFKR